MGEDFIIFTYTDGKGIVPKIVEDYLKTCGDKLKGVVATGNMERHADTFCWAGDIIAKDYNVPCLYSFPYRSDESAPTSDSNQFSALF